MADEKNELTLMSDEKSKLILKTKKHNMEKQKPPH